MIAPLKIIALLYVEIPTTAALDSLLRYHTPCDKRLLGKDTALNTALQIQARRYTLNRLVHLNQKRRTKK